MPFSQLVRGSTRLRKPKPQPVVDPDPPVFFRPVIPPDFRTVCRVWLVRHGETNMNRTGLVKRRQDTLLNEEGILQAKAVAEALRTIKFDYAVTSDLPRCLRVSCTSFLSIPQPFNLSPCF